VSQSLSSFSGFWPFYCREHSKPLTRRLHLIGSVLGPLAAVAVFLETGSAHALWLWAACGYGFAWVGHFFVEKNRPATFRHPFYSLAADYVMVWKMLTGKMDGEVEKALQGPMAV
jgi:hypothetical protein